MTITTAKSRSCPSCEAAITVSMQREPFIYGVGDGVVALEAEGPVYHCAACGGSFTDVVMEEAKLAAIRAHDGQLTPVAPCPSCQCMKAELDRRRASDLDDNERKVLEWVAKEIAQAAKTEKLGPNEQIVAPVAVRLLRLLAQGLR